MSARSKLKAALRAIDAAKSRLYRLKNNLDDDYDVRQAIYELERAESEVKRAMRDVPDE